MQWDLGIQGMGVLVALSLAMGVITYLLAGRARNLWYWLMGSAAAFVAGLLTSEGLFGWATEEDLQPNIDGLSFDEVLLFTLLAAVVAGVVSRMVLRRTHRGERSVEGHDTSRRHFGGGAPMAKTS